MTAIIIPEIKHIKPTGENKPGKKRFEPDSGKDVAYYTAFWLIGLIGDDIKNKTRHYRTKAGELLTTLDQIIQAALDNNLLITVPASTVFYVPPSFARCPYCDSRLYGSFTSWVQEDGGTWIGEDLEMECESQPDFEDKGAYRQWVRQHTNTPYVHWMPVELKVKEWINSQYRFVGLE